MEPKLLLTEQQRFRQAWLWILLIIVDMVIIYKTLNAPADAPKLIAPLAALLAVNLLLVFARLDTEIRSDGIYYRFLPFQWAYRKIGWERISRSYVRKYNPISEYGGWGIRFNLFGNGWAFNISGNKGLQVIYDGGKKFLIGTQKPEEVKSALQQLGQSKD